MSLPPELWDGVLRRLGAELPRHALEAWVRPLVAEMGPGGLRLRCPSAYHRGRIEARLFARIERCVEAEAGHRVVIELEVREPGLEGTPDRAAPASAGSDARVAPERLPRAAPWS